jgi:hypothetical protein
MATPSPPPAILTEGGLFLETESGVALVPESAPAPLPAVGSQPDIVNRLQRLIPNGWFPNGLSPIRDAILAGFSNIFSFVFSLILYVRLQTRIATATDGFLDMIAADFFGTNLPRQANQGDISYRSRIQSSIFLERATRNAVIRILTQLTGRAPIVFEPQRTADTGVYGGPGLAYGVAGGYGSTQLPYQSFVIAFRPPGTGLQNIAGYGTPAAAYNTPTELAYVNLSQINGQLQDADIFAAVDSVKVLGTIIWMRISN